MLVLGSCLCVGVNGWIFGIAGQLIICILYSGRVTKYSPIIVIIIICVSHTKERPCSVEEWRFVHVSTVSLMPKGKCALAKIAQENPNEASHDISKKIYVCWW